jgi:hypothetical protein
MQWQLMIANANDKQIMWTMNVLIHNTPFIMQGFKRKYGSHLQSNNKASKPGTEIKYFPIVKNVNYVTVNFKAGSIA